MERNGTAATARRGIESSGKRLERIGSLGRVGTGADWTGMEGSGLEGIGSKGWERVDRIGLEQRGMERQQRIRVDRIGKS